MTMSGVMAIPPQLLAVEPVKSQLVHRAGFLTYTPVDVLRVVNISIFNSYAVSADNCESTVVETCLLTEFRANPLSVSVVLLPVVDVVTCLVQTGTPGDVIVILAVPLPTNDQRTGFAEFGTIIDELDVPLVTVVPA